MKRSRRRRAGAEDRRKRTGTAVRPGGSSREESPADVSVPPADAAACPDGPPERATHRLYVHVAWTTLDGLPLLAPDAREAAEARIIALCRRLDAEPVAVRASAAGVSLLLRVTPSHTVGALATALKVGSEDALAAAGRPVRWARGFAASSVGPTEVRRRARRLLDGGGPPTRAPAGSPSTGPPSRSASRPITFRASPPA
jgi:hypothetical protein